MSQRLNIDASLVGYWGFDEALEANNAIDATANALNLSVTASDGTAPGRVGNSRHFDGVSSFASVTSGLLRLVGDLTLMVWGKLGSFNGTGTQLRCLLSCGGPTSGDNSLYCLTVGLNGSLSYRHTSSGGEVVVSTPSGTIRTGQFYFIVVRRIANGPNQDIELYVDNVLKTIASVTVNGVASALPVPPPAANINAIFSVGRSQREANSAFWDGYIDEVSVHNVARPYHAYLIEAYYRGALRSTTTKLSATNTVVAVSSYEMGSGVRWWCVERDQDLYVVKESPFGNFGPETRLTTVGGSNSSRTGRPELIYDAATDTLYVFFVAGNRVYKLTAGSTDDPATINMPFTADTGSIIKALDNVEGGRLGEGSGQRDVLPSDITIFVTLPVKFAGNDSGSLGEGAGQQLTNPIQPPHVPQIAFLTLPALGFGIIISPRDSEVGGYAAYEVTGGVARAMSAPVLLADSTNRWFAAIPSRQYGRRFTVEALNLKGGRTGVFSEVLVDRFGEVTFDANNTAHYGRDGDGQDEGGSLGEGSGQREVLESDFSFVIRTPIKLSGQDPVGADLGEGSGQTGSVTQASKTVML